MNSTAHASLFKLGETIAIEHPRRPIPRGEEPRWWSTPRHFQWDETSIDSHRWCSNACLRKLVNGVRPLLVV